MCHKRQDRIKNSGLFSKGFLSLEGVNQEIPCPRNMAQKIEGNNISEVLMRQDMFAYDATNLRL